MQNKRVQRTRHKVSGPLTRDVRQKNMKTTSALLSALVAVVFISSTTYADTNDITITSVAHSNGTLYMSITAPPFQPLTMDYSYDLLTWMPLQLITNEVGGVSRVGFVSNDGHADITHTLSSSETKAYYRVIEWDLTDPLKSNAESRTRGSRVPSTRCRVP